MWMIAWAAIKTFVSGNWINILKYGAIVLTVLVVWWKADSAWDNYKQAVADQKVEYANQLLGRQAAEVERDRAMQAVTNLLQQRDMLAKLVQEQLVEQEEVRQEYEDQIAVFEGHDLTKIAQSNHEVWVGKLATEASNEVLKELQNAFNY